MKRRAEDKEEESTTIKSSQHSTAATHTATHTDSKDGSGVKATAIVTTFTISVSQATTTAEATTSPLPQAWDGNLHASLETEPGSNCPTFLDGVLKDPSYKACYPLSMMLQTSQGFFNAQKNLLSIVRVLDATCAANVTYCSEFFNTAATNLTAPQNCKAEWDDGNTAVKEFLFGMQAYQMMYQATCLQDPKTDMYCFASAVTNATTASNAYFYYLPYNLTLPGSTNPSCGWCTQETMTIFHSAAADRSKAIARTYVAAAQQVNTICGLDFVNGSLPKAEASFSPVSMPSWTILVFSLIGVLSFSNFL
ncbi:hypothetical protein BGZ63DRAFT_347185 [Mariannaea sp. PMI_226]|nr:hypothetical protein BGZ63DRAFT_347185 [Mariannaea sp. PMI_226]